MRPLKDHQRRIAGARLDRMIDVDVVEALFKEYETLREEVLQTITYRN